MSHAPDDDFKHGEITEKVIGVFFDVYNELGFGFLESVYHRAMLIALAEAGLKVDTNVPLPVYFRGHLVGEFIADILVERAVILELKAADGLAAAHDSQLLNYLRATACEVGLLLNFGPKPKFKRLAFANERKRSRPAVEFS
jgi:GxxExxY protein